MRYFMAFEFCLVMEEKINACQTLTDLAELERTHFLNEEEQRLVFERRLQIFLRIHGKKRTKGSVLSQPFRIRGHLNNVRHIYEIGLMTQML